MRSQIIVLLLVAASVGAGVGGTLIVQSIADGDAQHVEAPNTKTYERKLTGVEAAAMIPAFLVGEPNWTEEVAYRADCTAADFNETKKAWVIKCISGPRILTFRVFDATGRVEWVQ